MTKVELLYANFKERLEQSEDKKTELEKIIIEINHFKNENGEALDNSEKKWFYLKLKVLIKEYKEKSVKIRIFNISMKFIFYIRIQKQKLWSICKNRSYRFNITQF